LLNLVIGDDKAQEDSRSGNTSGEAELTCGLFGLVMTLRLIADMERKVWVQCWLCSLNKFLWLAQKEDKLVDALIQNR
uniref:Kinesin motor domain-containing protein n=1 Tax=Haemonchus placei TaxID=6290 RepID=A0A0N4WHD2_HAEPC